MMNIIGPGQYQQSIEGITSKYKNQGNTSFGTAKRKFFNKRQLKLDTPGPGFYSNFSEFGIYSPN